MMKKIALLVFFAILIVFPYTVYADGPYLNIPPTNAFSQINTTNGTVSAQNFIASVKLQGLGSTVITADNATHTIYISSGHITPVGDRFGWFAVNTSPNLQNQHFYNFSTGPGITATVSADDFILSAINFVNATSKICGSGNAVTAFDNNTGTFTCSPFIQTINGNSSANHFINGTAKHIKVTDIGSSHFIDTIFKINNATCTSGQFFKSYDNNTGILVCASPGSMVTLDTIQNIGTGQASIYAGNTTNTNFTFKTLKQGQGITLTNNTNDVTIATNFKVNNVSCAGNSKVSAFNNSTGAFTCTGGTGAIQTGANIGTGGVGFFKNNTGSSINLRNLTTTRSDLFTLTQSSNNVNLGSSFKSNTITCVNQFVSAFSNVTGLYTCTSGNSGTITSSQNIGKGTVSTGVLSSPTSTAIRGKNVTSLRTDLITISSSNSTDVNLSSTFKSNSITCVSQFFSAFSNVTGLYTCGSVSGFLTSLNSQTGPAISIVRQLGNTTITNNTNSIVVGLGVNPVIINGKTQNITKTLNMSATAHINGLFLGRTVEKTSNYTPTSTDDTIIMNVTSSTLKVTLPTSNAATAGKLYYIKMVGYSSGNVVQIDPASGQTISGFTELNMTHNGASMILQSNGTSWNRLDHEQLQSETYILRGSTTRWIDGSTVTGNTVTFLDASSSIYAIPWIVGGYEKYDKLGVEITSAANPTSTTCRVALYNDNGNAYPSSIVSGTDAGTSTTGAVVHKYNFTNSVMLHPGLYWKALSCSTAATTQPTFRALAAGLPNVIGYAATGGQGGSSALYKAATTFGAMPTTFPSGASAVVHNTQDPPLIMAEMIGG